MEHPNPELIVWGVKILGQLVPFCPSDELGKECIASTLQDMVETDEQLRWLIQAAANQFSAWPGLAGLRALYCTRYRPMDGLMVRMGKNGRTRSVNEAILAERAYFEREAAETRAKIEGWKKEKLLAPPEDRAPFLLPAPGEVLKRMPAAKEQRGRLDLALRTVTVEDIAEAERILADYKLRRESAPPEKIERKAQELARQLGIKTDASQG